MNAIQEMSRAAVEWDGVKRGYIPKAELTISPKLALHRASEGTVDPITYEVLRNSLIGANFEHGAMLQQLCVSPVVIFARDFQTALLTETGDMDCVGPNLQYFANSSSLVARWILENRSDNPGIGADARATMAAGRIPQSLDEIAGDSPPLRYKASNYPGMNSGDVFGWASPTTAGWGDPLRRAPDAVLRDIEDGQCSEAAAAEAYGVIVADGAIDEAATAQRRHAIRTARLGADPRRVPEGGAVAAEALRVGDCLVISEGHWWCDCGARLGPCKHNYKSSTAMTESSLQSLGPGYVSDDPEMAERMVLRAFHCPECGTRIDTEIALRTDEIFHDVAIELRPPNAAAG